jgi:adenylate cyclase
MRALLRALGRALTRELVAAGRLPALGLLVVLLGLRLWDPPVTQLVRARVFDLYQQLRPRSLAGESPVAIVDIDERSIAEIGQFPWPRHVFAQLIARLADAGAGPIGFDIVWAEADRTSVSTLVDDIPPEALDEPVRTRLKRLPGNDAILAQAIAASGRVVLGQTVVTTPRPPAGEAPRTAFALMGDPATAFVERHVDVLRPLPELDTAAAGRGIFSVSRRSIDGIVRQVPMVLAAGDDLYPALVLEMLRVKLGARTASVAADALRGGVTEVFLRPPRTAERTAIKTDAAGQVWVYFRPHESWAPSTIAAADVIRGRVAPERIAGKFVLVGTSAQGLLDLRASPLDAVLPGVEVHANILENVLLGAQLSRPAVATTVEWSAVAVLGLVMIALTPLLGARAGAAVFLAAAGGGIGVSWYAFAARLELYDPTFAALAALAIYVLLTYFGYVHTERSRAQVRTAFGRYLSPALVERLADDPARLVLGGEMREMTFMFCDIRGFSGIAEQFDAQGLTSLINRLLTPLTDAILAADGTIDKYMGDAVMAFWNAPLPVPDHAAKACRAALAMVDAVAQVNAEVAAEAAAAGRAHRRLAVGIGINTGTACVGNMGSRQRFDYSVLGDDVNLASRLEGQSKTYGVTVVLGETTARAAADFASLELDLIRVKGKSQAARVFALVGDGTAARTAWFADLATEHGAMLAAYRRQDWDGVARAAAACRRSVADRGGLIAEMAAVYDLYAARAAAFRTRPPPPDWDGVYVAETK